MPLVIVDADLVATHHLCDSSPRLYLVRRTLSFVPKSTPLSSRRVPLAPSTKLESPLSQTGLSFFSSALCVTATMRLDSSSLLFVTLLTLSAIATSPPSLSIPLRRRLDRRTGTAEGNLGALVARQQSVRNKYGIELDDERPLLRRERTSGMGTLAGNEE